MSWQRVYKLTLGSQSEAKEITDLRVTFEIDKTISNEPNFAQITIYNLNAKTRELISTKTYKNVKLEAGYKGSIESIFLGEIIDSSTKKDDVDILTNLKCSDCQTNYNSKAYFALKAGSSEQDVIDNILKETNSTAGTINLPNLKLFSKSKVIAGNIKEFLDQIAKNNKSDWYFLDGKLNIVPKNQSTGLTGYELSQDSGLVGMPEPCEDGLQITALLNTNLNIGSAIRVKSIFKEYDGDYKIIKLVHKGDIMGDVWHTQMIVENKNFKKIEDAKK